MLLPDRECPRRHCVFLASSVEAESLRSKFSLKVTGSKCSGLTQNLFLQRWSMTKPSGIGPLYSAQATRWARPSLPPLRLCSGAAMCPYPSVSQAPIQTQQPLGSITNFSSNRWRRDFFTTAPLRSQCRHIPGPGRDWLEARGSAERNIQINFRLHLESPSASAVRTCPCRSTTRPRA